MAIDPNITLAEGDIVSVEGEVRALEGDIVRVVVPDSRGMGGLTHYFTSNQLTLVRPAIRVGDRVESGAVTQRPGVVQAVKGNNAWIEWSPSAHGIYQLSGLRRLPPDPVEAPVEQVAK